MNDIYRVPNHFFFLLFSDLFFFRKIGGEFWEDCFYFGTELSVALHPLLCHDFFSLFLDFFDEKWVILLLGIEEILKGLG